MRTSFMSICAFIGAFGLAGLAPAGSSPGASSPAGHGGGGAAPAGAAHAGGAAHEGHASAQIGSRIPLVALGNRERSGLGKIGFVDAFDTRIEGHNATVAVFHRAPLTTTEKDHLRHYHFKGFNECAGHGGCAEQAKAGEEMYCRRARNVAITSDLECLSFQP